MKHAVAELVHLAGYGYLGIDPRSFEARFEDPEGVLVPFDALPTRVRHLVAFGALSVRTLWAARPDRDPIQAEGIVLIDEVDLHQDETTLTELVPALRRALPRVQWVVTTTSPAVAASCDEGDVVALRRTPERGRTVELYLGSAARTH